MRSLQKEQIHSSNNSPKEFSANKKWQKKGRHKKTKESQSSQVQHTQHSPHKNSLSAKPLTKYVKDNEQIPNAGNKNQKQRLKSSRSQNSPTEPLVKVRTHAALYKNPEEFSSNWKKLLKVCSVVNGVLFAFALLFLFICVT